MVELLDLRSASTAVPVCRWMPAPTGAACASVPIDVVAAGVPHEGPPAPSLAAMLSKEELDRYAQLRIRKRRVEWLAGRIAAKHALQWLTGAPDLPCCTTVRCGPSGRPAFRAAKLSISHSRRDAMAAAAQLPVGIDTETFDALRASSLTALVRPWEVQAVADDIGCDAKAARTLVWCIKEALFKAAGYGGFVRFATALQVRGWPPQLGRPLWRWDPHEPAESRPALSGWRVQHGLGRDAAWVLVMADPANECA